MFIFRSLATVSLAFALLLAPHLSRAEALEGSETIEHSPHPIPIEPPAFSLFNDTLRFDIYQRTRWEIRQNNYDFDASKRALTDDNWFEFRFRLGARWQPVPWLMVYAQGQDAREWLSDRADIPGVSSAEGDNSFDLRQGYIQIGDPTAFPLVARIGRQTLQYGSERLVGRSSWNNTARSFDAVRLAWVREKWQLEAFASTVAVIRRGQYDQSDLFNGNEVGRDLIFSGVYLTHETPFGTADLYSFWLSQANGNVGNTAPNLPTTRPKGDAANAQHSSFGTYGGRLRGEPKKLHGWEFEIEGAYQNGEVRDLAQNAFAVTAGFGYNFAAPWKPRLWTEYNFATGDHDPNDRRQRDLPEPLSVEPQILRLIDLFSWQNLHNPMISFRVEPTKRFAAQLDFMGFWLADTNDAWYGNNGITQIRPITAASRKADNFVGTELDLTFIWNINKRVDLQFGYNHFFPGRYVGQTGPSDDADFGYTMVTLNL